MTAPEPARSHSDPATEPGTAPAPVAAPGTVLLTVRPRRIAIFAWIAAAVVVGAMGVIGFLLRDSDEGVPFRLADQIGLIGFGVIMGLTILTTARPRLRVTPEGISVRNIVGEKFYEWPLVRRIAFPQGAPWAQVILPDDETHPLMAIQGIDRGRAVQALRRARALHEQYAPPETRPAEAVGNRILDTPEPDRPLGRLEIIDQRRAARKRG
ncbi:hypothetical protein J2S58_001247 [Nakamurella flavida]|uniref:PH domain-containing protein n=1 Tax=Nakamurella flavida TaxID=363630 RepID=UPI00278A9782|nr:PH domain-containing protein [Nakamurella flavida]MDP9777624.1 hypothetical protein [Nakamurella flavida]